MCVCWRINCQVCSQPIATDQKNALRLRDSDEFIIEMSSLAETQRKRSSISAVVCKAFELYVFLARTRQSVSSLDQVIITFTCIFTRYPLSADIEFNRLRLKIQLTRSLSKPRAESVIITRDQFSRSGYRFFEWGIKFHFEIYYPINRSHAVASRTNSVSIAIPNCSLLLQADVAHPPSLGKYL